MPYGNALVDLVQEVNDLCDKNRYEDALEVFDVIIMSEKSTSFSPWIKTKKILIYRKMIEILIDKAWEEEIIYEASIDYLTNAKRYICELKDINEVVDDRTINIVFRKQLGDEFWHKGKATVETLNKEKRIENKNDRKNQLQVVKKHYEKVEREYKGIISYDDRAKAKLKDLQKDLEEVEKMISDLD